MVTILILLVIAGIVAGLLWMFRGKQAVVRHRTADLQKYESFDASDDARAQLGGLEKIRSNPMFWGVEMGQPGCETPC